jgi:WD40 repeat protein
VHGQLAGAKLRGPQLAGADASPDGKWLVTGGDAVRVFHSRTGHEYRELLSNTFTNEIRFSPTDPRQFAVRGHDKVYLCRVGAKKPDETISFGSGMGLRSIAYSPDGQLIAISGATRDRKGEPIQGAFSVWNVAGKTKVFEQTFASSDCTAISFSADGSQLAAAVSPRQTRDSRIQIFGTEDWESVKSVTIPLGFAISVSFTPDGKRLVIAGGECEDRSANGCKTRGKFWLANLGSSRPAKLFRPNSPTYGYFRGARMASDGQSFMTCTTIPKVDPGGRSYSRGALQARSTTDGQVLWEHSSLSAEPSDAHGLTLLDDGKMAAYCSNKRIHLVKTKTGASIKAMPVPTGSSGK